MKYRWSPTAAQRRAFAERMQNDPVYAAAYTERKRKRLEKKKAESQFDYDGAGGYYIATKEQHDFAVFDRCGVINPQQEDACNQVAYSYICKQKIHHDFIHIVNELMRKNKF